MILDFIAAAFWQLVLCLLYGVVGALVLWLAQRGFWRTMWRRLEAFLNAPAKPSAAIRPKLAVEPVPPQPQVLVPVVELRPAPTVRSRQWPINPPRPRPSVEPAVVSGPPSSDDVAGVVQHWNAYIDDLRRAKERQGEHRPKHGQTEQWEIPADLRTPVNQSGRL